MLTDLRIQQSNMDDGLLSFNYVAFYKIMPGNSQSYFTKTHRAAEHILYNCYRTSLKLFYFWFKHHYLLPDYQFFNIYLALPDIMSQMAFNCLNGKPTFRRYLGNIFTASIKFEG